MESALPCRKVGMTRSGAAGAAQGRLAVEVDERRATPAELQSVGGATRLSFDAVCPLLASPDGDSELTLAEPGSSLIDQMGNRYPIRDGLPILVPAKLQPFFSDHLAIPEAAVSDAFLQYFYLSGIKQSGVIGEINAPSSDVHFQRHLFRMKQVLTAVCGRVLDVGCDDPLIGASLLPLGTSYVGLDPFCRRKDPFRIVGFAENLPFCKGSFDTVIFNTSLDHILDWRKAIDEARRVLVPGGTLVISTLVWTARAGLATDSVHFHHFRDYEIMGALADWKIISDHRYDYKGNEHRHGMYLMANKPDPDGSTV